MKFPLSLLTRFLVTDATLEQISATLTAIGLEVDGIEDKSKALKQFVVAEILHAEKHPQADKLQVCKVKAAQGELQIVCGAPNARAGIKVALANIGTIIPNGGFEIKAAKVRGVESQGMMCSADELNLGGDSTGIIELPLDAAIGTSIVDVLGLGDPVLDINVTANRGDCMSVYGIARDLSAAGLGTLKPLCMPSIEASAETYPITIEDTDACPMFIGRIIRGVKNGTSPEWMRHALTAAGMRPISTLVDITNYFTLAFGRPLHVYDVKKLKGGLVVRKAKDGEQLAALNEKTYTLTTNDCVIADDSGAIGIGGIMGGSSTAVDESTTDILLEIALFHPERIAKTGRRLMLDSDARTRFERGVDIGFLEQADVRASDLILELCGGNAGKANIVGNAPQAPKPIGWSAEEVNALGGTNVAQARMIEILSALGFKPTATEATPPTWRHDVHGKADIAEEVLRIVGYDAIPLASLPKPTAISKPALDATQRRTATLRRALAARGLDETYSWSFCSQKQLEMLAMPQREWLTLLNPISEELSVMRRNILPHLFEAIKQNAARSTKNIALFELGAVFGGNALDYPYTHPQHTVAGGIRTGSKYRIENERTPKTEDIDVFDVKADVFAALESAGIDTRKVTLTAGSAGQYYHPARVGTVRYGAKDFYGSITEIASFGEIHPRVLKQLNIDFPVFAFEIFLDNLPPVKAAKRKALSTSDYQAVTRDFAFVLDEKTAAADLLKAVNGADKALLRDVTIFDVYQGKNMAEGKKSIALTATLQADDRTLTEAEIDAVAQSIVTAAMKIGATLRA